jgi:uncharacterized protein YndB with AHSA1/START domain
LTARREVRITRTFDAPRELVFRAWIDPDQLAEWLAPAGLEVPRTSVEVDARPGGLIEYAMVETGGQRYPVRWEIIELTDSELLVLESPPQPEFGFVERMTTRVVFEEEGDRTRVTITQGPHTDETIEDADAGWTSVLDNLDRLVRTASP